MRLRDHGASRNPWNHPTRLLFLQVLKCPQLVYIPVFLYVRPCLTAFFSQLCPNTRLSNKSTLWSPPHVIFACINATSDLERGRVGGAHIPADQSLQWDILSPSTRKRCINESRSRFISFRPLYSPYFSSSLSFVN